MEGFYITRFSKVFSLFLSRLCTHVCMEACVCMCGGLGLRWSFPSWISTSFTGATSLNVTQRVSLSKFSCPACPGNPVSTTLAWQPRGPEDPNSGLSRFYAKGFSHRPTSPGALIFPYLKIFLKAPQILNVHQKKASLASYYCSYCPKVHLPSCIARPVSPA